MSYYDLLGQDEYDLLGQDYDILGSNVEILGNEDLELLGAIRRARAGRGAPSRPTSRAMQSAVASRVADQGAVVRSDPPTKSRRLYLPINSGVVVAGAAANVLIQPPQPIKIEELHFDPVQAVNFQVTALSIGRQNQNLTAGAVAATLFSALNPKGAVHFDTAQTSEPINLAILNVGGVNATLTGMFIVLTVE